MTQRLDAIRDKNVLIVANLPYIGIHETIGEDVHLHDPHIALFGGGEDGFDLIRELLFQGKELSKNYINIKMALEF